MMAFSFDTLIDFLCFIGYYLVVGISSFSTQILSMVVLWNLPSVFRIMAIDNLNHSANVGYIPCIQHQCKAQYLHPFLD